MRTNYKIGGNMPGHDKGVPGGVKIKTVPEEVYSDEAFKHIQNEELYRTTSRDISETRLADALKKAQGTKAGQFRARGGNAYFPPMKGSNSVVRTLDGDKVMQFSIERGMNSSQIYQTILNKAESKIMSAFGAIADADQKDYMRRQFVKRYGHERLEKTTFMEVQDDIERLMIGKLSDEDLFNYVAAQRDIFREEQGRYAPKKFLQQLIADKSTIRQLHDGIVNISKGHNFDIYDAFGTILTREQVHRKWNQTTKKKDIVSQGFKKTRDSLEDAIVHVM